MKAKEKEAVIQYLGHRVTGEARDYSFAVHQAECDPRQFSISVGNEAFATHRVRFQDAAEICMIRLRQELLAAPHMAGCALRITDGDLEAYRTAHAPKKRPGYFSKSV